MNYFEYTTVNAIKDTRDIQEQTSSVSDSFILAEIRRASRDINDITNRHFAPVVATRTFDMPGGNNLNYRVYAHYIPDINLDDDLLELTTLTNGDGTVITSTDYKLYPLNSTPKEKITLLATRYVWLPATNGVPNGAISMFGTWGYHQNYNDAWEAVTTLSAAITTTSATNASETDNALNPGDLIKIDSEFMYIASIPIGLKTMTVVRGVNGSTAATHVISAPIYRYNVGGQIESLARSAATAYTLLRSNPMGESYSLDGETWHTPKDVLKWLGLELASLGLVRLGMG